MEASRHKIMDNRVQLFMRPNSPFWWCSCSINGAQQRKSTGEESLSRAKDVARDWYLSLLGKVVVATVESEMSPASTGLDQMGSYLAGELRNLGRKRKVAQAAAGVTFSAAADQFLKEIEVLMADERNPQYVHFKKLSLNVHLLPFFGSKLVTEITPGVVQEYRVHRMTSRRDSKGEPMRPARSTLHQEIVCLRQVLKTANRHGWLPYLPDLSSPYKANGKVGHRAWFSPEEYEALYTHTGKRAKKPPHNRGRWKTENEDLHDYVLFMTNTGLRPDEAGRLELRDISIVNDEATGEEILEIAVRGKRGTGWCKSMPGAVYPFQRMVQRHNFGPKDIVFGDPPRELLNNVLGELDLKFDREGNRRTSYSFRHTYISMRLMEGADIYQVAKNCRTSVEMVEKHYAVHIKDMIDTAAVNRRKPRSDAKPSQGKGRGAGNTAIKKAKKSTEIRA